MFQLQLYQLKGNAKLLQQLKLGFKRTITRNKYQSKVTLQKQNWCLNHLNDPIFQGGWADYTRFYLPLVEIKNYNVMIDAWNVFDQPVRNN